MLFLYAVLWSGCSSLVFLGTLVCVLVRRQRVYPPKTVFAQPGVLYPPAKEVNLVIRARL